MEVVEAVGRRVATAPTLPSQPSCGRRLGFRSASAITLAHCSRSWPSDSRRGSSTSSCSAVGSAVAACAIACTCAVESEPARAARAVAVRAAELLAGLDLAADRSGCAADQPGDVSLRRRRRRGLVRVGLPRAAPRAASSSWRPSLRSPRRRATRARTRSPSAASGIEPGRDEPHCALRQLHLAHAHDLRQPASFPAVDQSREATRGGLRSLCPHSKQGV